MRDDNIVNLAKVLDKLNAVLENVEEIKGLDINLSVDNETGTVSGISIKLEYCKFHKATDKEEKKMDTAPTTNPNPQYPLIQPGIIPNYTPDFEEWWKKGPQCSTVSTSLNPPGSKY